jgi:hypothetical protein
MDKIPVIRFKRIKRERDYATTRYEVYADGVLIGQVYTAEVAHDRKPRGSRIVTSRTYSDRWFTQTVDLRRASRIAQDTRVRAVALLLEKELGLPCYDARELAKTGRNFKKDEEV